MPSIFYLLDVYYYFHPGLFYAYRAGPVREDELVAGILPAGWIGTVGDLYPVSNTVSFLLRFRCLLVSEPNGLFFVFHFHVTSILFLHFLFLWLVLGRRVSVLPIEV